MAEAGDNIRVYLRVRPFVEREDSRSCAVRIQRPDGGAPGDTAVVVGGSRGAAPVDVFAFDDVGCPETPQAAVFDAVARPVVAQVLSGYNGTILAYGQTGSGKTYTMQGPAAALEVGRELHPEAGLIPRALDMLFASLEADASWSVSAMFVEIYNEVVYDLLAGDGECPPCTLREDARRGTVFVEGCREVALGSVGDALAVLSQGARARHVAETAMNRESSRSHSVLTVCVRSSRALAGAEPGLLDVRESRLHLVDLAGSERQQYTAAAGQRLKEAGSINKSLLALASVINALVERASEGGGRRRHVQYRDSRLTFLLRDSLGGNARTAIVAAVSPAASALAETLSTLRFAARAKLIKNRAVVNALVAGTDDVDALHAEIGRLRARIADLEGEDESLGAVRAAEYTNGTCLVPGSASGPESSSEHVSADILQRMHQRHCELADERDALRAKVALLEEQLRRKEHQVRSERMVARLRDSAAQSGVAPADALLAAARTEAAELRKQLECHPDVLRYAYEAMQHQEALAVLRAQLADAGIAPESPADFAFRASHAIERERQLLGVLARLEARFASGQLRAEGEGVLAERGSDSEMADDVPMEGIGLSAHASCASSASSSRLPQSAHVSMDDGPGERDTSHEDMLRKELEEAHAELMHRQHTSQAQQAEAQSTISRLREALSVAEARATRACDELASHAQTRVSLSARLDESARRCSVAEAELVRMRDDTSRAQAAHAEREAALLSARTDSATAHGQQLGAIRTQLASLSADLSSTRSALEEMRGERDSLAAQLSALADGQRDVDALRSAHDALADELEETRDELLRVRRENDKLAAHSNVKQKLQYHMQIKEENNAFREEVRQLRDELARLSQRNMELSLRP